MSAPDRTLAESQARDQRIDQLCAELEADWRSERRLTIEGLLSGSDEPERAHRFRRLMQQTLRLGCRDGDFPMAKEYLQRFPEYASIIEAVFRESASGERREEPTAPTPQTQAPETPPQDHEQNSQVVAPQPNPSWPTLDGYEITAALGAGGMGVVYKAWQPSLNRFVAVKMLRSGEFASDEELGRFLAEAKTAAQLDHPSIVHVYEVGEHRGRPYFSMEWVPGGSLSKKLAGAPLPALSAAALVETLARAMQHAHERGIIHRDLKPANILVGEDWKTETRQVDHADVLAMAKITDFGLAKWFERDQARTPSGAVLGTPSYMAPEQAFGKNRQVGPAADVYALGAVLYELLTGRPPFRGTSYAETLEQVMHSDPVPPASLQPKLHRDLEKICLKCLRKEPQQRYPSAIALAEDLHRFQAGLPVLARPVGRLMRLHRWCGRNKLAASLMATVAVLFITGFVAVFWQWLRAEASLNRSLRLRDQLETASRATGQALSAMTEGSRQTAITTYRKALAIQEQLAEENPEDLSLRAELAGMHTNFANLLLRDPTALADSLRHHETSVRYWEGLTRSVPGRRTYAIELAKACNNLGIAKNRVKQREEAVQLFLRALTLLGGDDADPTDEQGAQSVLATTYSNLGNALDDQGKLDEALRYQLRAVDLSGRLAANDRDSLVRQRELAGAYNNLAVVQKKTHQTQSARESYERSIAIQTRLAEQSPDDLESQSGLSRTYFNLGLLCYESKQLQAAASAFQKAAAVQKEVLTRAPDVPESRIALGRRYSHLAGVLLDLGRVMEAAEVVQVRKKLWPANPDELYLTAMQLSSCIASLVRAKPEMGPAGRSQQEVLVKEAVATLKQAILHGYKDRKALETEPALDAIRSHPEFKQLLSSFRE